MTSKEFELGSQAFWSGKSESDNPFIIGTTKLGNQKFAEGGADWLAGFIEAKPMRVASKKEIEAANSVEVSRFRRKSNRYYK